MLCENLWNSYYPSRCLKVSETEINGNPDEIISDIKYVLIATLVEMYNTDSY